MLCSLKTEIIVVEVQCGECLYEAVKKELANE